MNAIVNKIENIEPAAILIPVYIIDYSYNNQQYKVAINGHKFGKWDHSYDDAFPKDETKTKGLFNKISVSKEKRNYKKEARDKFEQKLLSDFKMQD